MRVKDFILMYSGMNRVEVEIYASVTVFNEEHYVPVAEFAFPSVRAFLRRRSPAAHSPSSHLRST